MPNLTVGRTVPPIVHEVRNGPGQPLDAVTRASMEPRFGQDFSTVRIHNDTRAAASAAAVNALAYTVGTHIAFARGNYSPDTVEGGRLLAHELAHTIQQSPAPAGFSSDGGLRVGDPQGSLEQEADALAEQARRLRPSR
jgi:hypothetical protein